MATHFDKYRKMVLHQQEDHVNIILFDFLRLLDSNLCQVTLQLCKIIEIIET